MSMDNILDNFETHIAALTPDDLPDILFVSYDGDIEDASQGPGSDRRFTVLPADGIEVLSPASPAELVRFKKTVLVMIQYRTGRSLKAFVRRVHNDADRIVATLRRPASYARGDDWALIGRQPTGNVMINVDEQNLSAIATIPFETIYSTLYEF